MIWHSEPLESVISELKSDITRGLNVGEADSRLKIYGKNESRKKSRFNFAASFTNNISNYVFIVLIAVSILFIISSIILNNSRWIEPLVIIIISVLSITFGILRDYKAEAAITRLNNLTEPSARVVRDKITRTVPASQIVPGDIILLETGCFIPADCRLIEVNALRCDESVLTGETIPVEKKLTAENITDITPINERINMVFAGCYVLSGSGRAIVTSTAESCEICKIVALSNDSSGQELPTKSRSIKIGNILTICILTVCAIVFLLEILRNIFTPEPWIDKILQAFLTGLSLTAAAVPQGFAVISTLVLLFGLNRLKGKNVILRNFSAVEKLASTTVICADKTGTFTQNKMTVTTVFDGKNLLNLKDDDLSSAARAVIKLGALSCNPGIITESDSTSSDPSQAAIISAAIERLNITATMLLNESPRLTGIPFSPERKLMSSVNMIDGKLFSIVRGAPEILFSRCVGGCLKESEKEALEMSGKGLRVIGVGIKQLDNLPTNPTSDEIENGLTLVGLLGLYDPPRPEAVQAVKACHRCGIKTVMITGDHLLAATATAKEINVLDDNQAVLTGEELDKLTDDELLKKTDSVSVFARVSHSDKQRIVDCLKKSGHTVVITGDNLTDAPALRAADVGCAMGITGTDVAKVAADMTVEDDNFATIVTAVENARGICNNIRRTIFFLANYSIGVALAVLLGIAVFKTSVFSAAQILISAFIVNFILAAGICGEPTEKDIMLKKYENGNTPITINLSVLYSFRHGITVSVVTLAAFILGFVVNLGHSLSTAITMSFATLIFSHIFLLLSVRTDSLIFKVPILNNPLLLLSVAAAITVTLILMLTPLRATFNLVALQSTCWLEILGLSLVPSLLNEFLKALKSFKKS